MAELAASLAGNRPASREVPAGNVAPASTEGAMIPYAAHEVSCEDVGAVAEALLSDRITQGPRVGEFEDALALQVGTECAVAVSSGTASLHVALLALGVGPGDEVIVPPLSFVATSNAVLLCGATPIFADVEADTLSLSPEAVAKSLTPRTRGAIPMHFGGHPADVDAIRELLGPDRFVLEDACHALGALAKGRPAGTLGDAACFSFHPAKLITTGEGGAVTTSREDLARRMRSLREHGIERDPERFVGLGLPTSLDAEQKGSWIYEMQQLVPNYRLSEPAAALGVQQLSRAPARIAHRRDIARAYGEALSDLEEIELPIERPGHLSAWHLYPIRLRLERLCCGRAQVFDALRARGIGVQVHYIPIHLQPYYRRTLGSRYGDHPVAEAEYLRLITLPLHTALSERDISRVVEVLRDEIRNSRR